MPDREASKVAKVTIVEGTVLDPHHVEAKEPLPAEKGQAVLIVVGAPTYEGLTALVQQLMAQERWEEAIEVIRHYQQTFYEGGPTPFADLIITPLLNAHKFDEALEAARQIPDEFDHDIAFVRIIFKLAEEGMSEHARELVAEVRDPKVRSDMQNFVIANLAFRYADAGEMAKALEVAQEMPDENQRRWLQFLLEWDETLKTIKRQYPPEELRQLLVDERGD